MCFYVTPDGQASFVSWEAFVKAYKGEVVMHRITYEGRHGAPSEVLKQFLSRYVKPKDESSLLLFSKDLGSRQTKFLHHGAVLISSFLIHCNCITGERKLGVSDFTRSDLPLSDGVHLSERLMVKEIVLPKVSATSSSQRLLSYLKIHCG